MINFLLTGLLCLNIGSFVILIKRGSEYSRKIDAIHVLVNSNLTRVQADLKLALDRVLALESLLVKERKL